MAARSSLFVAAVFVLACGCGAGSVAAGPDGQAADGPDGDVSDGGGAGFADTGSTAADAASLTDAGLTSVDAAGLMDAGPGPVDAAGLMDAGPGPVDAAVVCTIGAVTYADGATNPDEPCQVCAAGTTPDAWTALADTTSCGAGEICAAGTCAAQCIIDGTVYASGAVNPIEACRSCQPSSSFTAWTAGSDGTGCGSGLICTSGTCGAGCLIDSTNYAPHAVNPANACESCEPSISTTDWTADVDGTSCDTAKVCASGSCAAGCFINGTFHASGATNPANGCQRCEPTASTTAWSDRALGTSCGTGKVCNASSSCVSGCFIGGKVYASGAANPSSSCQTCQPGVSTTAWSNRPEGASCGTGDYCGVGVCARGTKFAYSGGKQSFKVPSGTTQVTVEAIGANGGGVGAVAYGGVGGIVKATIPVTAGETLTINVGGGVNSDVVDCSYVGGYNGGGNGGRKSGGGSNAFGCGGGGASDVRRGGTDIGKRVVVAGGGGGCGGQRGNGGAGGGSDGGAGTSYGGNPGGGGGTQSGGGTNTRPTVACNSDPSCKVTAGPASGGAGYGGGGGETTEGGGGGGGGGYYGGAGGQDFASGGGGGSGWAVSTATHVTSLRGTGNAHGEDGMVIIFY